MKYLLKYIFVAILISSCAKNLCSEKESVKIVSEQLDYLEDNYMRDFPLTGNLLYANLFLSKLSRIESLAEYGDVSVYQDYNDYKIDLKSWKIWLKENQCEIEREDIESIVEELSWLEQE